MNILARAKQSFTRWLRVSAEKVARRFYEGPEPPERLFDELELFEKLHPNATADEWRIVARGLVSNAYRDGYIRGFEHRERLPKDEGYERQKWLEAEAHRHDWALWQGQPTSIELRRRFEEQRQDPTANMTSEERSAFYEALARHNGGFRVVWPGEDDPMPWRKDVEEA